MEIKRIKLNYKFDSLEPHFDAKTMEIHYDVHHKGYETKLLAVLEDNNLLDTFDSAESLVTKYQEVEDPAVKTAIREFGGGLVNHNIFFDHLKVGTIPTGELKSMIIETWGSIENFQEEFKAQALSLFGSGWVWLGKKDDHIKILKTFNQDTPFFIGYKPIFGLDVWEHAYYIKFNAARADYIDQFWNVLDWDKAEENYLK